MRPRLKRVGRVTLAGLTFSPDYWPMAFIANTFTDLFILILANAWHLTAPHCVGADPTKK